MSASLGGYGEQPFGGLVLSRDLFLFALVATAANRRKVTGAMSRIASIDDSQADSQMIEGILRSASHEVLVMREVHGVEGAIQSLQPDLVLLDVVMPERSGYEILRKLKKGPETKGIPVILVSSKGESTDIAWGKRQGSAGYVVKPFTAETLLAEIGRALP
jgi:twitching motility two-component system response regulator PilH